MLVGEPIGRRNSSFYSTRDIRGKSEGHYTAYAIKGESRIEYHPYERVYTEINEVKKKVQVPIKKKVTDYYAVQTDIEYIPQTIKEKIVDYVPVERQKERVEYQQVVKQKILGDRSQQSLVQVPTLSNVQSSVFRSHNTIHPQQHNKTITLGQRQQTFGQINYGRSGVTQHSASTVSTVQPIKTNYFNQSSIQRSLAGQQSVRQLNTIHHHQPSYQLPQYRSTQLRSVSPIQTVIAPPTSVVHQNAPVLNPAWNQLYVSQYISQPVETQLRTQRSVSNILAESEYPGHPDFTYYFDPPPKNDKPDPRVPLVISRVKD